MVINCVRNILRFLNKIIIKSEKKIVFNSYPDFSDNSRALFTYMYSKEAFDFNYIWLINDSLNDLQKIVPKEILESSKVRFVNKRSLKGIYEYVTSKYIFHTHGLYGNLKPPKNQVIVNLWHGMPIKKIGLLEKNNENLKFSFTYTLATSNMFKEIMKNVFGCSDEEVLVVGQPRNDFLLSDSDSLEKVGIIKDNYKKIIFWMPTYRESKRDNNLLDGIKNETGLPLCSQQSLGQLNRYLKDNKILLIVKFHPLEKVETNIFDEYENISILTEKSVSKSKVHLYELLGQADALLTDYSSVFFDFLVLNKPIGFIIDDFEKYSNSRGFIFNDVLSLMPGSKIYEFKDLVKFIKDISSGKDLYEDARKIINSQINKYISNNCERLLEKLNIL